MISYRGMSIVTRISTILTRDEQDRVDAAGIGLYVSRHRKEPREVLGDIRQSDASMVLISVRYCETQGWRQMAQMIHEMPRVPVIGLLSAETRETIGTLMKLGQQGLRHVVDVRSPEGWRDLRRLLVEQRGDWLQQEAVKRLQQHQLSPECWSFFETMFRVSKSVGSVRVLSEMLEILPSTLMSRFYRAGLPTPKRYLAITRLIRAAHLFENDGFSIANVANHLEYSSPQSFGRHIRGTMQLTALQFRRRYTGESMLNLFEHELVCPYSAILMSFNPFSGTSRQRDISRSI